MTNGKYTVPIAAASDDWLTSELLPAFVQCCDTGKSVVWVPCDSPGECEYVLSRIANFAGSIGRRTVVASVPNGEPLTIWDTLFGHPEPVTADDHGLAFNEAAETVVVMHDFHLVSPSMAAGISERLAKLAAIHGWLVVLGVLRNAAGHTIQHTPAVCVLEIPSLRSLSETELRSVAVARLADVLFDLDSAASASLATQIAHARPQSRQQLDVWLEYYAVADPEERQRRIDNVPPPSAQLTTRVDHYPPYDLSRMALAMQLTVSFNELEDANRDFHAWMGEPLVERPANARDPFASSDPAFWFVSLVSTLYSTIFDHGNPAIEFMAQYEWNVTTSDLISVSNRQFFRSLHALRTTMQHGMRTGWASDADTQSLVESWYEQHCNKRTPTRSDWRLLCRVLLDEWSSVTQRLRTVCKNGSGSASAGAVYNQLMTHRKRLSGQAMLDIFRNVVRDVGSTLDPYELRNRHMDTIRKQVEGYHKDALHIAARQLAEEVVLRESNRCPIRFADVTDICSDSARAGRLLEYARGAWNNDPCLTRDTLLELVRVHHAHCESLHEANERSV